MDDRYLQHITLTTGDSVRHLLSGSDPASVAHVSELLEAALAGREPEIMVGYSLRAAARGHNLRALIVAGETPILTTGVARRSRTAPDLWQTLHDDADARLGALVTDRGSPPPTPWIADRIEIGLAQAMEHAMRTGDMTGVPAWTGAWGRLLGWAWMGREA